MASHHARFALVKDVTSGSGQLRHWALFICSKMNHTSKTILSLSLLGRKRGAVVVRRIVCGRYQIVGQAKPDRRGRYVVRFNAPGLSAAALYRAESRVRARPGARRLVKQFARALGLTLTGQSG